MVRVFFILGLFDKKRVDINMISLHNPNEMCNRLFTV